MNKITFKYNKPKTVNFEFIDTGAFFVNIDEQPQRLCQKLDYFSYIMWTDEMICVLQKVNPQMLEDDEWFLDLCLVDVEMIVKFNE